jgi:hypothetical protein
MSIHSQSLSNYRLKILFLRVLTLLALSSFFSASAQTTPVKFPLPFVSLKEALGLITKTNSEIIIKDMPRVRDQKQFEICFGMAPTVLVQRHICQIKGIEDCDDVSREFEVSPLSTMSWFQKNTSTCTVRDGKYFIDAFGSEVDPEECGDQDLPDTDSMSYANVRFAGNGYLTLKNAATLFSFHTEACFASDRFFHKFGGSKESATSFINEMKQFYYSNRNKEILCPSCLVSEARGRINTMKVDESSVRAALQMKNFQEFMFKLMFRDCERVKFSQAPLFKQFPDIPREFFSSPRDKIAMAFGQSTRDEIYYLENGKKVIIERLTRELLLGKIKETLNMHYPLMLDNLCIRRSTNDLCLAKHSVIIKGQKEVCDAKVCKDFLMLQNSWGDGWQSDYDGGWVEAKSLLANVDTDTIRPGILSWYEKMPLK